MSTQFDFCASASGGSSVVPVALMVFWCPALKWSHARNCLKQIKPPWKIVWVTLLAFDGATAAKLYDASRLPMTADGTVTGDTEKKMTGFVL